jgi:structural maintenance of chromosome 2
MREEYLRMLTLHSLSMKAAEDAKDADKTVQHMLEKHEWISVDRKYFGEPGSAYDFKANDPKEAGKRIGKLEEVKVD